MNLKKILYYKAKLYVEHQDVKQFLRKQNLKSTESLPLEMFQILETVTNYKSKANVLLDIGAYTGEFSKAAVLFF